MISQSEGIAIVKEAWALATQKVEERPKYNILTYFFATGIAAGTMGMLLAMATHTEEGAWGEIYRVSRVMQDEFLGKYRE
jgi:hypothetical protein